MHKTPVLNVGHLESNKRAAIPEEETEQTIIISTQRSVLKSISMKNAHENNGEKQ